MGSQTPRLALAATALALAVSTGARASEPMPGDAVAPPANYNIFLYYNAFANAGAYGSTGAGGTDGKHTRISVDVQAMRYIHTFETGGFITGVQIYVPYATFLGPQSSGVANIGTPAGLPAGTPGYGAGKAELTHASGFGQPSFGAFFFPYNNPVAGDSLTLGAWVAPPVSGYNSSDDLNYAQSLLTGEIEAGAHATLIGTPTGQNLELEVWGEGYFYGSNSHASYISPEIYADSIPGIYQIYHSLDPLLPDSNPLQTQSTIPARLSMQPTEELRIYLPYQFFPASHANIVPGFYQSFGGKQIDTFANGEKLDNGTRTNETQLRLTLSTYVNPHWQIMLNGEYDLLNHGGPLYRTLELRLATAF